MNSAVNMSGWIGVLMLFTILLYLPPVRETMSATNTTTTQTSPPTIPKKLSTGTEWHNATVCCGMVLSEPPRCDEGSHINVSSASYDTRDQCRNHTCVYHTDNPVLYEVIWSQCDGATSCLTNTNEAFWDSVICPAGNWADILYTCQTNPSSTTSGMLSTEIWIGILIAALSVTAGITVLAVLCVRRRKREQKPAPSTGSTGHRDTTVDNVYKVSGGDDYDIVQLPLTTIHPELPNPDPEVYAPGPDSSSRDPETSHQKLDRAPEALDGGASGGQAREPEVYAAVRRDRQEDDELDMKENEAYGHL